MPLNSFQTSGSSPTAARCRIGILGFGTVGSAVARRLTGPDSPPTLQLTAICDRRAREKRDRQPERLAAVSWTDQFDDLIASDADIILEAVSGAEPASDYVRAALLAGKSVVTANTRVVAHHGPALMALAERQGRQFRFEASVAGAMPIVRALTDGLAGDRVVRVQAILNGTANAVLSHMDATACTMDEAIADACGRGFAEANPAEDLEGADAAAKLAILCALSFGLRVLPSDIETETTARLTPQHFQDVRQRGFTIRQIAHAAYDYERSSLVAWVAPIVIARSSFFARAVGADNAAIITGVHAGDITMTGLGAGGDATAVAAIGDLVGIARDRAAIVPAPVLLEPKRLIGLAGPGQESDVAEAV